jgi:hypothetical protein
MRTPAGHFVRHYFEMIAAMFLGMLVVGMPADAALRAAGDGPAVALTLMSASMTIPMVAWMRYRGHGWAPCAEMSAAMILPTALVLGLLWGGALADEHTLMMIEHVVMFPAMLVAMLLRRDEYTGAAGHHRRHAAA